MIFGVSGTVGDAYLALMLRTGQWAGACDSYLAAAMDTPVPRVALGQFLSHFATACADISDGFLKDLGNILVRSNVGAEVYVDHLAVSPQLAQRTQEERRQAQLAGGDDYELSGPLRKAPDKTFSITHNNVRKMDSRYY